MTRLYTDLELIKELEPTVEDNLNRHLSTHKDWNPHDYVPWDLGSDYAEVGGRGWSLNQSGLSEVARVAMLTNLLTEDNLPSYHREIAMNFSMDGAWGTWVNRWTVEENRHGIALRDYLIVTRAIDPVALEQARIQQMTAGFSPGQQGQGAVFADTMLKSVAYVTFQELATRVSHRNTGKACDDPVADQLLKRVAGDENLHMVFYRNIVDAALDLAPTQAIDAICWVLEYFQMPGFSIPNFRRNAITMAVGGIYDLRQHLDDVVMPVLRKWRIFERTDLGPVGERRRDEIAVIIARIDTEASKFEESRDRYLEREERRAERKAASLIS